MTSAESDILRIVDGIYDAALAPERWPNVLTDVSGLFGGNGATLLLCGKSSDDHVQLNMAGGQHDPSVLELYEEYFPIDVRYEPISWQPAGQVFTDETVIDRDAYHSSQIYQEFFRPCDLPHLIGANLFNSQAFLAALTIQGGKRRGPFRNDAIRVYEALLPHLIRAIHLQRHLATSQSQIHSLRSTLANLPFGALILEKSLQIVDINHAAEQFLKNHDGICSACSRLVIADNTARTEFEKLVRRAIIGRLVPGIDPGGVMRIPRPSGRMAYSVAVSPVPRVPDAFWQNKPAAIVLVFDPESKLRTPQEVLIRTFNFTAAEARLVAELATGVTMKEASVALGVSENTVKTQLRNALSKAGVKNQRALMDMIASTVASLWRKPED